MPPSCVSDNFLSIIKYFVSHIPPRPPIWYSIEPARIEANQKMRVDAEEAQKKREQALLKMKIDADEANQKREQALLKMKAESDEATRKREQLFMEHELKRQKNACGSKHCTESGKIKG